MTLHSGKASHSRVDLPTCRGPNKKADPDWKLSRNLLILLYLATIFNYIAEAADLQLKIALVAWFLTLSSALLDR